MSYSVAVVGTGANPGEESVDGYAMGYRHAQAYERLDNCELVACADLVRENAEAFADTFGLTGGDVYEDYEEMLTVVEPDIVSVCVPPAAHAEIVVGCAESGVVDAVHCEKPMARTWRESREMVTACEDRDVQLTINHQRRFAQPFRKAKQALDAGQVGALQRIEIGGPNLYDYGTHLFDMCGFITDQEPVTWVMGQIDYREPNVQFGVHNENQAIVQWRYESGVSGLAATGDDMIDCQLRLIGEHGTIEVGASDLSPLRIRTGSGEWRKVDTGRDSVFRCQQSRVARAVNLFAEKVPGLPDDVLSDPGYIDRAIEDVVSALEERRQSELAAANALEATEIIFAAWESARQRGRIDLPLTIDDNPLLAMVENEQLGVLPRTG